MFYLFFSLLLLCYNYSIAISFFIYIHFFLFQSRSELSSPSLENEKLKSRPPKCPSPATEGQQTYGSHYCVSQPSRGLAELTSNGCSTPPATRRRMFLPKSFKSPFGIKRNPLSFDKSTHSGKLLFQHIYISIMKNTTVFHL